MPLDELMNYKNGDNIGVFNDDRHSSSSTHIMFISDVLGIVKEIGPDTPFESKAGNKVGAEAVFLDSL